MTAQIIFADGNWWGMANGRKVVKSYDQTRVVKMMIKAGYKNVPIVGSADNTAGTADTAEDADEPQIKQWPINTRFDFVSKLVSMVARGTAVSLIVTGPGGLGKTHTVTTSLQENGIKDISGFEVDQDRGYRMIKGYSTAKGLYRELYANRDGVIVFDDCDDVLKDATALNLLKGALDSYDRRIISWNADMRDDDLPRSFQFNGRVIFISNMPRNRIDTAVRSRAYCIDLDMTLPQKLERMAMMAEQDTFMPQFPAEYKQDAMQLITEVGARATEINLRTLQAVTRIRAGGGAWRELAEYTLVN